MAYPSIDRYQILEKLGEGGMGVLYRARDTRLARTVALKLLREDALQDPDRRARFVREARAASALNHPNIVTVYDIDKTADGSACIAMEYVEGRSLDRRLAEGPLPLDEALGYALEVARALAAAHAAGIVHRDVKPANVMLTSSGQVKVLDFGLAKLSPGAGSLVSGTAATLAREAETRTGVVMGTPAYASPEQARGEHVDARSDVFSFGVMLYEMLAGRRPFQGESVAALVSSILRDDPPPLATLRPGIPSDVAALTTRCLLRDPAARYASADELLQALLACQGRRSATPASRGVRVALVALGITVLALVALLFARATGRSARERTARRETLPEIERLAQSDRAYAAFALAKQAAPLLEGDPAFDRIWQEISLLVDIRARPAGAQVAVKPYLEPQAAWEVLGQAPLEKVRLPFAYLRWRAERPGYEPFEGAFLSSIQPELVLMPAGSVPKGMVRVPGGPFHYRNTKTVSLDDFFLDRFEVTNRQYKEFVDQGGYREEHFWKQPFLREGRTLSWREAMTLLLDTTGRPGPAGWELGGFAEGEGDLPVSGVSWYEAAAFAEFTGKSLPGFHHWYRAAELGIVSDILLLSNFSGRGPAPVGSHQGIGPFGTYDQAGNVREWAANAARDERRFTLGGAWNDPTYLYSGPEVARPWDRLPTVGFRCAKYSAPPAADALGPVEYATFTRDYAREKPVGDVVFAAYRSLYAYDHSPLQARVLKADDSSPYWRKETVSFAAGYGDELVTAQLYLPKPGKPPFQVVVYFPPSSALLWRSMDGMSEREFSFLVRSGRAVLFPMYKGTFERRIPASQEGPNVERDMTIQWSKDLGRSLDYLETRTDVRADRVGYLGLSMGAYAGLLCTPLEPRIAAVVLLSGGLRTAEELAEVDPLNFAPRVTAPVLLVGGRDDFRNPLELSQKPLMRLLGSKEKRHYIFEGGHVPPRQQELMREVLEWFDKHLGPV